MISRFIWWTALLCGMGCDRSHMSPQYGRSVRGVFGRQVIDRRAGSARSFEAEGLDPQEAAIVAETYRRSLSPRPDSDAARRPPVMVVAPNVPSPLTAP